jgi:anti-sigma regulatory factor (Ser/Thr protein kinase)
MTLFANECVFTGRIADLPAVGDFIAAACAAAHVGMDVCPDLQLATEEACSNVINHAYAGAGGEFCVRFEARGPDAVITIHDHGKAFDPTVVPRPNLAAPLEERPLGGLGLHLMHRLMDEVVFTFSADGGNTLVMVKRGVVAVEDGPNV